MKRSGTYISQPSGYKAFIPNPLPPKPSIEINDKLKLLLEEAKIALGKLNIMGFLFPNQDYLIAMYVRKEALLSSQIEGTQASLEDIFQYESHVPLNNVQDVQEVVNYIKAMNHGIKRLQEFPMSIRLIKEIHAELLDDSRGDDKEPGEFRRTQNWIGSPGSTIMTATFVPPPPHEVQQVMGQLEFYLHQEKKIPELVNCALIHYQFETIHPFLDGNGRLGRLLITFYLFWKRVLDQPLLYMSCFFKMHRQEYYDRLSLVRESGDYEQWVTFFLKGVLWASESALTTIKTVLTLKETHKQLLLKHVPTTLGIALSDFLFQKPFVSCNEVADHLQISFPSAQNLINKFLKLNLLKEITKKKRDKRYCYWEYVDCLAEGT